MSREEEWREIQEMMKPEPVGIVYWVNWTNAYAPLSKDSFIAALRAAYDKMNWAYPDPDIDHNFPNF